MRDPSRKVRYLIPLILAAVALIGFPAGEPQAGEPVGSAEVVWTGLLFDGGRFVPGPYELKITAADDEIRIVLGGLTLDRFPSRIAPTFASRPVAEPEPYEVPLGVDALKDSGFPLYLHRLLIARTARFGRERALDEVQIVATDSRLVNRVEKHPDGLLIVDRHGDPYFVEAGPFLEPTAWTQEELVMLAERTRNAYRVLLDQGGAILHMSDGDLFLPRVRVDDVLVPSLRVLEDLAVSAEEKRAHLIRRWKNERIVEELLAGYRESVELQHALRRYRVRGGR